ncbi:hypothetical protein K8I61_18890 [bacterium]|nr:hypothetical protein [bacterium]
MRRAPFADLVASRHPLHIARENFWRLAGASYRGGRDYIHAGNLFSHRLENGGDHDRRLHRAYYLNYCRPVVDTYASYVFRVPPAIVPDAPIRRLIENADGRGGSLYAFMKRAFTLAAIHGHVVVGVDRPVSGDAPETRADEIALGLADYLHLVSADDFVNWETDGCGCVSWCLVRERTRDASPDKPGASAREVYRLWTAREWALIDGEGEVIARGENPYGRAPFVSLRFRDSDDPVIGESLLASIVYVNREIFNLGSLLSEILYRQTFSQLVAEGSAEEYGEAGDIARLGTSSIFLYPEGRNAPSFIHPDVGPAEVLMRRIDGLIDEVYRLASLVRGSAREGNVASGIAKAYDFLDTNQALADAAAQAARAFEQVLRIAHPEWGGVIEFPGDFGADDPGRLLAEAKQTLALPVGPAFRRRILERLARTLLREIPATHRDDVFAEIAAADRVLN